MPRRVSVQERLEIAKGEIIGLLTIGTPKVEICRQLRVNTSSLWHFEKRHRADIDAALEKRSKRLEDYYVSKQVDRIAELQWWYDKTKAEAEGFGVVEVTDEAGRAYRSTMVKEARGLLRDAAEELGQIKQPAKTELNDRRTYVLQLVRNDHSDIPQLG